MENVLLAALALPDEEQLQLVAALLAAVDERGLRPFDDSWMAEIQRRSAEYDAGSVQPIPWAEVKEEARARFRRVANVAFLPAARDDYREALDWYWERSARAAAGFEAAVEVASRRIAETPEAWPLCDDRHRFYILRRYPFSIVYRIESFGVSDHRSCSLQSFGDLLAGPRLINVGRAEQTMTLTLQADPLPLRVEEGGGIRVGTTRVHLEIVIEAFENGASPESIVQSYDTLQLADVYAVLAYFLRHKEEVQEYIAQRNAVAEEWRRKLEASQPPLSPDLLERLRARKSSNGERECCACSRMKTLNGAIIRGIRRRQLGVDLIRMQEVGLRTQSDEKLLDWAAADGRMVISNDRGTLIGLANARTAAGLPMPGIFVLRTAVMLGQVVDGIILLALASDPDDWTDRITFIPL